MERISAADIDNPLKLRNFKGRDCVGDIQANKERKPSLTLSVACVDMSGHLARSHPRVITRLSSFTDRSELHLESGEMIQRWYLCVFSQTQVQTDQQLDLYIFRTAQRFQAPKIKSWSPNWWVVISIPASYCMRDKHFQYSCPRSFKVLFYSQLYHVSARWNGHWDAILHTNHVVLCLTYSELQWFLVVRVYPWISWLTQIIVPCYEHGIPDKRVTFSSDASSQNQMGWTTNETQTTLISPWALHTIMSEIYDSEAKTLCGLKLVMEMDQWTQDGYSGFK